MSIKRVIFLLLPVFVLSACEAQSDIQAKYIAKQDDCRNAAEDQMDAAPNNGSLSAKQRNANLVDKFSTCMIKAGWHVARPLKNPTVPTPPGTGNPKEAALPAQPLPGQPSDVITAASPAQPAKQSSPPNEPVKTQPSLLQPSPSQPALSDPASAVGGNAPATYQRVYTPDVSGAPSPGRQF